MNISQWGQTTNLGSDHSQVELFFEQTHYLLDLNKIDALMYQVQKLLGVERYETSLDWLSQDDMRQVNLEYRGKDSSTDVLSFPQHQWNQPLTTSAPLEAREAKPGMPPELLGDILISLSDAQANAESIGHGLDREGRG